MTDDTRRRDDDLLLRNRYGDLMDDGRRNLLMRVEILGAYIAALEDPEKLIRVCRSVSGELADATSAVATAFNVSDIAADAILAMQVKKFTPGGIERVRSELADLNQAVRDLDRP